MTIKTVIRTPNGPASEPVEENGFLTIARPCEGECDHLNCDQWRDWAFVVCPGCLEKIGYDRSFLSVQGYFVHTVCMVESAL